MNILVGGGLQVGLYQSKHFTPYPTEDAFIYCKEPFTVNKMHLLNKRLSISSLEIVPTLI